jgi:hypothetical protein
MQLTLNFSQSVILTAQTATSHDLCNASMPPLVVGTFG